MMADDYTAKTEVDLVSRDPNDINNHLKIEFNDIFGEPDGTHSVDCVWKASFTCYNCTKHCCYNFYAVFCGIFISFAYACEFASVAFTHVWCLTPCMRIFIVQCNHTQKCFGTVVNCFVAPLCEACGFCFNNISVSHAGAPPPIPSINVK